MEINKSFSSYEEFQATLKHHEQSTLANFYVSHSKRMKKATFRDKFLYRYIQLQCKLGGRFKRRGKEIRNGNTYRHNSCLAKITVTFNAALKKLIVSKITEHNHSLDATVFSSFPNQRRLEVNEQKEVGCTLDLKPSMRLVQMDLIERRGVPVLLKDLHNLKQKKNNYASECLLEEIVNELNTFENSVVRVYTNNEGVMEGLFFQDSRMKRYFALYPEVLIVDATYKLNDRQMPVMLSLIIDGNGESQLIAIYVIRSENYEVVTKMFEYFIESNAKAGSIDVIIADKSFADRKALQTCFPQAKLQICIFHVLQAFEREVTNRKREISTEQRKEALAILKNMVYAKTSTAYHELRKKLLSLNYEKVSDYFDSNWHECRHQWAACYTDENFNILNRTSNRVESMNHKLKCAVTRNGTIPKFFKELTKFINSMSIEKNHRAITSIMKHPSKLFTEDSPESKYQIVLTKFAFEKLLSEFEEMDSFDVTGEGPGFITFNLDTTKQPACIVREEECGCRFFNAMKLPCRHILKLLKLQQKDLFVAKMCTERWHKDRVPIFECNFVSV